MKNHQRTPAGVTLIELMISLVIGLFLVLGATTVYVKSRNTADIDDAVGRLQETARYALDVLESDVRMANYWGLAKGDGQISFVNSALTTAALSPLVGGTAADTCSNNFAVNAARYIESSNNSYNFADINGLCSAKPGAAVTSADTLTIRRASTASATLDVTTGKLQVCTARGSVSIIKGTAGDTCPSQVSGTGDIRDLIVNAYYVDQQSDQGSTVPSLRRQTLIAGPSVTDVEIIPGVEDMQIQFGWNSSSGVNATGVATRYVNPGNVILNTGQIVSVRIWLLVRAETADKSYTDTTSYTYGDRYSGNGVTSTLNGAGNGTKAYKPNDNYRRILVSRTIFLRNSAGA